MIVVEEDLLIMTLCSSLCFDCSILTVPFSVLFIKPSELQGLVPSQ